ncbi:MAG: DUF4747 family protein [Pseudomonadales bacterium]|nr:DUF4747 family protein [Pseudomonadales bacterium]
MAVFKFYNVQLLAIDTDSHGEVGKEGYRRLFQSLAERMQSAKDEMALERVSGSLINDFFFAPFNIELKEDYAQGKFIKYDKVANVHNLYTEEDEFKGGKGSTSKRYGFEFVFDFESHTLAIQRKNGLPSANPLMKVLSEIIVPVSQSDFPDYQLSIREMTSAQSLEKVFNAEYYKRVKVEVTFSNSADLDDALLGEAGLLEKDFKGKNVHTVEHVEKPARKGFMSGLSNIAKPMLVIAARFGNADVSYQTDGKWSSYHMKDYPVTEEVVPMHEESHDNYMARVHQKIASARQKTQVSKDVLDQLHDTYPVEEADEESE